LICEQPGKDAGILLSVDLSGKAHYSGMQRMLMIFKKTAFFAFSAMLLVLLLASCDVNNNGKSEDNYYQIGRAHV
jgi:hypothetical protein